MTVSAEVTGSGVNSVIAYILSETNATPAVDDAAWRTITSSSTSVTVDTTFDLSPTQGAHTVFGWVKDSEGNISSTFSDDITVQNTIPAGTLSLNSGAKLTPTASVTATITGTSASNITGYLISASSTTPGINDAGWVSVTPTTSLSTSAAVTLPTPLQGLQPQYLWLKNENGNISAAISDSIEGLGVYSTGPFAGHGLGQYSSITVNSQNVPQFSMYQVPAANLVYLAFTNGNFSGGTVVDSTGDVGAGTSIAVDSNNKIHIAYRDVTNSTLKYATNTSGSFTTETIESGGEGPSIGIDSIGNIHMSHILSSEVRYVTNTSGLWNGQEILGSGTGDAFGFPTNLAIGPNNKIYIANRSLGGLWFATNKTGSWQTEKIGNGSAVAGGGLTVDTAGTIYISYGTISSTNLTTNSGSSWVGTSIDTIRAGFTNIKMDSHGFLHMVYYDTASQNLKYATNYSGTWTTTTLDSTGDVGNYCDIAIDSNDRLHISYYDATNGDLKYATTAQP